LHRKRNLATLQYQAVPDWVRLFCLLAGILVGQGGRPKECSKFKIQKAKFKIIYFSANGSTKRCNSYHLSLIKEKLKPAFVAGHHWRVGLWPSPPPANDEPILSTKIILNFES
jgi:hypothetical protein